MKKKYQNKIRIDADNNFMRVVMRRREQINRICSTYKVPLMSKPPISKNNIKNLYWLVEKRIAYCPVFKSACIAWLQNLITLSTANKSIISTARKLGKYTIGQVKNVGAIKPSASTWYNYVLLTPHLNLTAFMIVRHPFERLVSAYRDKLERINYSPQDKSYFYETYGKRIV